MLPLYAGPFLLPATQPDVAQVPSTATTSSPACCNDIVPLCFARPPPLGWLLIFRFQRSTAASRLVLSLLVALPAARGRWNPAKSGGMRQ